MCVRERESREREGRCVGGRGESEREKARGAYEVANADMMPYSPMPKQSARSSGHIAIGICRSEWPSRLARYRPMKAAPSEPNATPRTIGASGLNRLACRHVVR